MNSNKNSHLHPHNTMFKFLQCFFLLFVLVQARAVKNYYPEISDPLLDPWRWRTFKQINSKGVICMAEDHDGNMWFGTDAGLYRYDGIELKRYDDRDDIKGVPTQLFVDQQDKIYLGTHIGVYQYSDDAWQLIFPDKASGFCQITCFEEDPDGSLWIGTNRGYLNYTPQKRTFYTKSEYRTMIGTLSKNINIVNLPNQITTENDMGISDILKARDGTLWISYLNSWDIYKYHPRLGQPDQMTAWEVIKNAYVMDIDYEPKVRFQQISNHHIWIYNQVSENSFILDYNPATHTYRKISYDALDMGSMYLFSMAESGDNNLWFGGFGCIYLYKNDQWKMYKDPDTPIPGAQITQILITRDGAIWLMGDKNEVWRLEYPIDHWVTYAGLNFHCEQADGTQWFISHDGFVVFRKGDSWKQFTQYDGVIDTPNRIFESKQGIWAIGSHRCIAATSLYDGKKWRKIPHPSLSWGIDYRSGYESSDGKIWFGSTTNYMFDKGQVGGVLLYEPDKGSIISGRAWTHFMPKEGEQLHTYGISEMKDGTVWFTGIWQHVYKDGDIVQIQEPLNARSDAVDRTPEGQLWVGTRGKGIFRHDGEDWKQYTVGEGLGSNTINAILCVSNTSVWAATDEDISHFDGHTWTSNVLHKSLNIKRESGSLQLTADGALWINQSYREWNRRAIDCGQFEPVPSVYKTTRYFADKIAPDTKIDHFEKRVPPSGNTVVFWSGHDPWEMTPKDKLQYSYRLNEGEWSPFSEENSHIFSDLKIGKIYTLEVRARDWDLNVDPTPVSVEIEVMQHFYQSGWFWTTIIFILAGFAFAYYQVWQRDKNIKVVNQNLTRQKEEIEAANKKLMDSYTKMKETSQVLATSSSKVKLNTGQINTAIESVTDGVGEQNEYIDKTRASLRELLDTISTISYEAERSAQVTEETADAVNNSVEGMQSTLGSMSDIEKSVSDTWEIVQGLGEHSNQIDVVVEIINDVASRVNVLALNAAIEATKAGKYGKGFMVVAQEIRHLARNVADSTQAIADSVSALQYEIIRVQKVIQDGQKRVKASAQMTNKGRKILDQIRHSVLEEQARIKKIAERIARMQEYSQQVERVMDSVADVSRKNEKNVKSVEAQTQEMTGYIDQLTEMAQSIKQMVSSGKDQTIELEVE